MKTEKLILNYQRRGIKLSVSDNKLHFSAPQNILTDEDKDILKKNKKEIIKFLLDHTESEIIVDEEDKYEKFPLTDIQLSYLVGQDNVYKFGGTNCKIYTEIEYEQIELNKAQYAWEQVIKYNDMLHAVINQEGTQEILSSYTVPQIVFSDLSDMENAEVIIAQKRESLTKKQYRVGTWPLFDVEITKLKNKYILHISLDMLVADFVSINVILNEFEEVYYNGKLSFKQQLSFRDIVLYKESLKKTVNGKKKYEEDKKYWEKRIPRLSEVPEFPVVEQQEKEVLFTQYKFFLESDEYEKLCDLAKNFQLTTSSLILTAYAEALRKISKNQSFCIDVTMVDRPPFHPSIDRVIGDFTTANILEVEDLDYTNYFEKAKKIQYRLWEDLSHNSFSSKEVLREMGKRIKKEITVPAVYTSTLGAVKYSNQRKGKILYTISQTPQVLIDCQVLELEKGVRLNWDVRLGVFPKGLIEEAFESFRELIYRIIDNNTLDISLESILPKAVRKIRCVTNNTRKEFETKYLHEGFFETLECCQENKALYSNGKYYSYKELSYYVDTIIEVLESEDVFKGDIVAVAVSKGVWQIAAVLGILSKGAVYLPLDIHQPSERVDKIIKSAHVKCCILEEDNFISHDLTKKLNIRDIKRKERSGNDYKQINIDIEAPAYVIFTSGSTGNPKGVIISHSAATNTILDINNKFKINSDDRILNISNLSFDLSVYDIFGTFFAGAELVQVNEEQAKDPAHWYDLLKHENISVFNGVPGQMKMLTMFLKGKEKPILDAVRLILLSGDWIPVDLPKEISKYFPNAEIVSLGGATEAAIWSIYYPINIKQNYIRSIPYGKPLANQRFYILNEKGEETLDWISGDIYIAGKGLAIGYLGDPELTEKKFIYSRQLKERLYKTGDIGRYMPDGTIEFQGRSDFQVKIRGHRVELGEIEMAIVEILHPKNLKVITVNNNDVISVCMFAVLENESDALSKEELGKYLSEKIPQYMIPVYCEYLSEIPLTVNGKIDIKVLTSRAIEGMKKSRSRGKSEQKLSETEENIYKVWCELFNTTDISVDEDFFECGGDSILVVKLLTELETRYQYKMSLMDVYSSPTIYKMAECITNQQ